MTCEIIGVYEEDTTEEEEESKEENKMRIRKLNAHKHANCGYYVDRVSNGKGGYISEEGMISYDTKVIIIHGDRVIYTGKYSVTTSQQQTWWLKEFGALVKGVNKKTLELMYNQHMAYDRKTGELLPLTKEEEREIAEIRHAAFHSGSGW